MNKKYLYHPLEFSICGHSNSGKTTLVTKLIEHFSKTLNVGYIKHDGHRFCIDHEGKDSYRAAEAGARTIGITSQDENALIFKSQYDQSFIKHNYIDNDVVLIEGYKKGLCNKLFIWTGSEDDQNYLSECLEKFPEKLLGIIHASGDLPNIELPVFNRDDVTGISTFIKNVWQEEVSSRPLYGLVLGGGRSSRMGQDKTALCYHGKSQVEYLTELLSNVTEKQFVSRRADQATDPHMMALKGIEDKYLGFGPTGGILSAFNEFPNAAWLVVACDMPFINQDALIDLVERRNPFKLATAFHNDERRWPEPLCSIYEPKAAIKLGQYLAIGKPCPRKVLMNSRIECLEPVNIEALSNVNTPDEFKKSSSIISGECK